MSTIIRTSPTSCGYSRKGEVKTNNNNLKSSKMTKSKEAVKSTTKKVVAKKVVAKKTGKETKKPAVKKVKKVGVIASILEFVTAGPVKESAIVKKLAKRFPDRTESSMSKTVKAQIGGKKQPTRMEKEKGIKFLIVANEKTGEKTFSIK